MRVFDTTERAGARGRSFRRAALSGTGPGRAQPGKRRRPGPGGPVLRSSLQQRGDVGRGGVYEGPLPRDCCAVPQGKSGRRDRPYTQVMRESRVAEGELSDEALLAGMAVGEQAAAVAFVRRYQRRVFGLAYSMTSDAGVAEDVAQEAMIRVWKHAPVFDPRRGSVASWVLTITRNLAIDALRLRRAVPTDPDDFAASAMREQRAQPGGRRPPRRRPPRRARRPRGRCHPNSGGRSSWLPSTAAPHSRSASPRAFRSERPRRAFARRSSACGPPSNNRRG